MTDAAVPKSNTIFVRRRPFTAEEAWAQGRYSEEAAAAFNRKESRSAGAPPKSAPQRPQVGGPTSWRDEGGAWRHLSSPAPYEAEVFRQKQQLPRVLSARVGAWRPSTVGRKAPSAPTVPVICPLKQRGGSALYAELDDRLRLLQDIFSSARDPAAPSSGAGQGPIPPRILELAKPRMPIEKVSWSDVAQHEGATVYKIKKKHKLPGENAGAKPVLDSKPKRNPYEGGISGSRSVPQLGIGRSRDPREEELSALRGAFVEQDDRPSRATGKYDYPSQSATTTPSAAGGSRAVAFKSEPQEEPPSPPAAAAAAAGLGAVGLTAAAAVSSGGPPPAPDRPPPRGSGDDDDEYEQSGSESEESRFEVTKPGDTLKAAAPPAKQDSKETGSESGKYDDDEDSYESDSEQESPVSKSQPPAAREESKESKSGSEKFEDDDSYESETEDSQPSREGAKEIEMKPRDPPKEDDDDDGYSDEEAESPKKAESPAKESKPQSQSGSEGFEDDEEPTQKEAPQKAEDGDDDGFEDEDEEPAAAQPPAESKKKTKSYEGFEDDSEGEEDAKPASPAAAAGAKAEADEDDDEFEDDGDDEPAPPPPAPLPTVATAADDEDNFEEKAVAEKAAEADKAAEKAEADKAPADGEFPEEETREEFETEQQKEERTAAEKAATKIQAMARGKKVRAEMDQWRKPVERAEKDGCIFWEATLTKETANDKYGFVQANGKMEFEQRVSFGQYSPTDKEKSKEVQLLGPDLLIVRRINEGGLLERWNRLHSNDWEVLPQDRIISVNSANTVEAMQQEIRTRKICLKFCRYPERFRLTLSKEGGRRLGFRFERPQNASVPELRISEVLREGALLDHNRHQISIGCWHYCVLPDMRIESANDVSGDAGDIAEELRRCVNVTLQVRRAELVQAQKQKVQARLLALRALADTAGRMAVGGTGSGDGQKTPLAAGEEPPSPAAVQSGEASRSLNASEGDNASSTLAAAAN
eukprot:gnl/TRDRNA2_/TRDRNA2_159012_c0_seq1.p1 gnl/TRDRNA2_/TRDRNA2_159012_c0~~gnl/TRDRNA2_/TRDRNA2_159012_c0_seq1.p1  ORF type:complete len:984 (-),score=259.79 gnl/TRDRNA2_/TRDRNA2_159012_c0_seq1:7-2958(-)